MYNYEKEKKKIFTEKGNKLMLAMRDKAKKLLDEAGAFKAHHAFVVNGAEDCWTMLAVLDYLEELQEICKVWDQCSAQDCIYVRGKRG